MFASRDFVSATFFLSRRSHSKNFRITNAQTSRTTAIVELIESNIDRSLEICNLLIDIDYNVYNEYNNIRNVEIIKVILLVS